MYFIGVAHPPPTRKLTTHLESKAKNSSLDRGQLSRMIPRLRNIPITFNHGGFEEYTKRMPADRVASHREIQQIYRDIAKDDPSKPVLGKIESACATPSGAVYTVFSVDPKHQEPVKWMLETGKMSGLSLSHDDVYYDTKKQTMPIELTLTRSPNRPGSHIFASSDCVGPLAEYMRALRDGRVTDYSDRLRHGAVAHVMSAQETAAAAAAQAAPMDQDPQLAPAVPASAPASASAPAPPAAKTDMDIVAEAVGSISDPQARMKVEQLIGGAHQKMKEAEERHHRTVEEAAKLKKERDEAIAREKTAGTCHGNRATQHHVLTLRRAIQA